MSEGSGVSNKDNFTGSLPGSSPRGPRGPGRSLAYPTTNGVLLFTDEQRCRKCGELFLSAAHGFFVFFHCPDTIEHAHIMGGVPSEWRPNLEETRIPGDNGPARVAFWQDARPQVAVHDGLDTGNWTPCSSHTITIDGVTFFLWVCKQIGPENPCDDAFMREISS